MHCSTPPRTTYASKSNIIQHAEAQVFPDSDEQMDNHILEDVLGMLGSYLSKYLNAVCRPLFLLSTNPMGVFFSCSKFKIPRPLVQIPMLYWTGVSRFEMLTTSEWLI
jgi:hypothetical protein